MNRLTWKTWSVGFGICAGLTALLFACGGDDSSKSSDAGGSGDDASKKHDAEASDSSSKKDSSAHDGGGSIPTPLNLCATLDSFWNNDIRSNASSWPTTIVNGPPSTFKDGGTNPDPNVGLIGYMNQADCNVGMVFNPAALDYTAWQNQLVPFEYRFFGCTDKAVDAGLGFELVPPNLYGMPFGPEDLQRLGDLFVASVIDAVVNQSAVNPQAFLTGDQIDQMQAEMAYQETLYPNIINKPGFHYSTCPADAGAEAGGD